jgi:hypothetical protein
MNLGPLGICPEKKSKKSKIKNQIIGRTEIKSVMETMKHFK